MLEASEAKKMLIQNGKIDSLESRFGAISIITRYVEENYDIKLITVGGSSATFYTNGLYKTVDIDFVGVQHKLLLKAFRELGMQNGEPPIAQSVNRELNLYVEVPSSILKDASINKVNKIVMPKYNSWV